MKKWARPNEYLPPEGQSVLVRVRMPKGGPLFITAEKDGEFWWIRDPGNPPHPIIMGEVTHWCDIPAFEGELL